MSLTFNGLNSDNFGLFVEKYPISVHAKRKRSVISIPGRNGDLTETQEAFENVTVSYAVYFNAKGDFSEAARKVSEWLLSPMGYVKLSDSYNPKFFRMAYYDGEINIEDVLHRFGRATLQFCCKPQLFSENGSEGKSITLSGETLVNPYFTKALPLITLTGKNNQNSGILTVGETSVVISNAPKKLYIDCENENVTGVNASNTEYNANSCVTLKSFPVLGSGTTQIKCTGDFSSVEIIPRWWTI